jgi:hypothetical protein
MEYTNPFIVFSRINSLSIAPTGWQKSPYVFATLFYFTQPTLHNYRLNVFYINYFDAERRANHILLKHGFKIVKITDDKYNRKMLELSDESVFRLKMMGLQEKELFLE